MSYSRNKVWIAAEILTAANLNTEFDGCITNENDLDSRLISEISARTTLESEYDTFYGAAWNAGDSQIANNKVALASMNDNSVGTSELVAQAVTRAKLHDDIIDPAANIAGARTLGTGSAQALPGNTPIVPADNSLVYAQFSIPTAGDNIVGRNDTALEGWSCAGYEEKKAFAIIQAGTYRIKFSIKTTHNSYPTYGRIYRNHVAVGTARNTTSSNYAEYSEDIADWLVGDRCSLYCYNTETSRGYVKDFRLFVANVCIGVPSIVT